MQSICHKNTYVKQILLTYECVSQLLLTFSSGKKLNTIEKLALYILLFPTSKVYFIITISVIAYVSACKFNLELKSITYQSGLFLFYFNMSNQRAATALTAYIISIYGMVSEGRYGDIIAGDSGAYIPPHVEIIFQYTIRNTKIFNEWHTTQLTCIIE